LPTPRARWRSERGRGPSKGVPPDRPSLCISERSLAKSDVRPIVRRRLRPRGHGRGVAFLGPKAPVSLGAPTNPRPTRSLHLALCCETEQADCKTLRVSSSLRRPRPPRRKVRRGSLRSMPSHPRRDRLRACGRAYCSGCCKLPCILATASPPYEVGFVIGQGSARTTREGRAPLDSLRRCRRPPGMRGRGSRGPARGGQTRARDPGERHERAFTSSSWPAAPRAAPLHP
jgi:hypothetical protein